VHVFVLTPAGSKSGNKSLLRLPAAVGVCPAPAETAAVSPAAYPEDLRPDAAARRRMQRQAQWIAREVAARGIEHLHTEFATAAVGRETKALTGIGYSVGAHESEIPPAGPDSEIVRETVDGAEFVIARSNGSRNRLLAETDPSSSRKILRIDPGVDLERLEFRSENGRDPDSVLTVAPLVPGSGVMDLIDALHILRARGAATRLTLVGTGELEHEVRAKIATLGLGDCVTLLRRVTPSRLLSLMRSHAVMALPYDDPARADSAGVSRVVLEAMAVGLPVVSTTAAGVDDVIEDGWSGRLISPNDPQWLAGAIETLLGTLRLRQRMAKDARQVVERRFALSQNVSLLAGLFANAAGQNKLAKYAPLVAQH
jgi:glycosyltransferase involved in cell wall biosynthesis